MKHELDEAGEPVHVDIDPFIATGICAICADTPQDTVPPEGRPGGGTVKDAHD